MRLLRGLSAKALLLRRIAVSLGVFVLLVVAFTVYANLRVEKSAVGRIYESADSVPHNRVALLLGTNPLNRRGKTNSYLITLGDKIEVMKV